MNAETFDALARLWAAAPTRRAFVRDVSAMMAVGLFGRFGIQLPEWRFFAPHAQCYPEREGMLCGQCGICQRGACVPNGNHACNNFTSGPMRWGASCGRCRASDQTCHFCEKEQTCCKDGCCDGPCTADGTCCPKEKRCGDVCCRGCEVCVDGKCAKPQQEKECPPNYTLIEGCCVCQRGLCGDKCCSEKEVCLGGQCCKECGKDKAICCDDPPGPDGAPRPRVCCRERCIDADKKCCPCKEDITPEEGKEILKKAQETMQRVQANNIKYAQERGNPNTMDCSGFVAESLGTRNSKGDGLSTRNLDGNCDFRRLEPGEQPQPGDVIAQPRSSGPPGSQHVGISQGPRSQGGHLGVQMGNSGAAVGVWGIEKGKGKGWFEGGDQMKAYRPQKQKKPCKE